MFVMADESPLRCATRANRNTEKGQHWLSLRTLAEREPGTPFIAAIAELGSNLPPAVGWR